ncbi:hypothetical protein F5Y07DRAFT_364352 [Xylaria sp. FL0933]|nr:hypothetical protein F5Y07DRAFT_364352 [Xylaria sp. FL0933]
MLCDITVTACLLCACYLLHTQYIYRNCAYTGCTHTLHLCSSDLLERLSIYLSLAKGDRASGCPKRGETRQDYPGLVL